MILVGMIMVVPIALVSVVVIVGSVISAYYYLMVAKTMFFDEPAVRVRGPGDWPHWALLIVATVFNSPLGDLLTGWLDGLAGKASAALFLAA